MKSLKLDDQFFIRIYIFVQKERHTYVIMAKSEVTGCVCFCQDSSSAANYHLSFHGFDPSSAAGSSCETSPVSPAVTLCRTGKPFSGLLGGFL